MKFCLRYRQRTRRLQHTIGWSDFHFLRISSSIPKNRQILLCARAAKFLFTKNQRDLKGIVSRDFGGLQMILMKRLCVPCGGACSPHLPEASRHYSVVVKAFASGQCRPDSIPGRSRSWSDPNNPPNPDVPLEVYYFLNLHLHNAF